MHTTFGPLPQWLARWRDAPGFATTITFETMHNGGDWPGWEVGRPQLSCAPMEGDVRLSAYPRGEVFIFDGALWTTLCGALDLFTATVLCRQLGYERAALTFTYWGQGYAPEGLSAPRCKGTETTLRECEQRQAACAPDHTSDKGIECAGGAAEAAGGPDASECGSAHIAPRPRDANPGSHSLGMRAGGELRESSESHHGRTVAPTELANALGSSYIADERLRFDGAGVEATRGEPNGEAEKRRAAALSGVLPAAALLLATGVGVVAVRAALRRRRSRVTLTYDTSVSSNRRSTTSSSGFIRQHQYGIMLY